EGGRAGVRRHCEARRETLPAERAHAITLLIGQEWPGQSIREKHRAVEAHWRNEGIGVDKTKRSRICYDRSPLGQVSGPLDGIIKGGNPKESELKHVGARVVQVGQRWGNSGGASENRRSGYQAGTGWPAIGQGVVPGAERAVKRFLGLDRRLNRKTSYRGSGSDVAWIGQGGVRGKPVYVGHAIGSEAPAWRAGNHRNARVDWQIKGIQVRLAAGGFVIEQCVGIISAAVGQNNMRLKRLQVARDERQGQNQESNEGRFRFHKVRPF